jgi:malonyl-CoA O-methyltransferase
MSQERPGSDEFQLEQREVRRSFGRAARNYDAVAVLQSKVQHQLLERLDLVRIDPAVVLDLGAGTGRASVELKRRYRKARVVALDLAEPMLRVAARRQTLLRRFRRVCADAAVLPLVDGCTGLIFSSLMLQWCDDLDQVLRECRRVLQPGGLFTFATLGPDTLVELRRAWAAADGRVHVNRFIDMHDLGDALVRSGLAEPVMDVERITLTYEDAHDLMRDLKTLGAHNASAGRSRGLTGKGGMAKMVQAYEAFREGGRLPATYEVVYGHAWGPVARRRAAGEVAVPLGAIGRRATARSSNI